MKKALIFFLLQSVPAFSQTPTIVYGASQTSNGVADSYLLLQPADSGNPLGNPIVTAEPETNISKISEKTITQPSSSPVTPVISETAEQDPAPFSESPQQEQNQIQNTLYQGGNRIYDVQSYPIKDIKTITEPDIQPTITTYPEY